MDNELPLVEPIPHVPLDEFPRSEELPDGCLVLDGLADDGFYQVEYREASYVTRESHAGPVSRMLYVLVPSTKDPVKASYAEGGYPCVVFCQGSGWHEQHVFSHLGDHLRLAERGFVVASVQYRESDIAPFPAQMQDFKTAIRFLRLHAEDYNIDPERMGAWGDSSGAHTVLMAGFTADGPASVQVDGEEVELDTPDYGDQSAAVRCIVDWYGPTAFDQMNRHPSSQDHAAPTSPEGRVLGGRDVLESPEWVAAASPLSYIAPSDEARLPPMLIMHGGRDEIVSFDQSVRLYEALRAAGQEVTFYKLPDAHHGSAGFRSAGALAVVEGFLREHLS